MDKDRAAKLQSLTKNAVWQELVAEVDEQTERYTVALAKTMLATGEPFPDFEYKRGYLAGMKALSRYPESALKLIVAEATKAKEEPVA